jgi:phage head maturation protease
MTDHPQGGPRGWSPDQTATRFADSDPTSFNAATRSVDCVISMGSPVVRFYGTEKLKISADAIDLSRMENGSMIPLLDSHQSGGINNALGRFTKTWIARGALMGQIKFNETPNGEMAMGMVQRKEIAGISAGYSISEWLVQDSDGNTVDPDARHWNDDPLTFTATRWSLHEGSLVSVPADQHSSIRSFGTGHDLAAFIGANRNANDALVRAQIRQRMQERQAAHDDRRAMTGTFDQYKNWRRAKPSSVFP